MNDLQIAGIVLFGLSLIIILAAPSQIRSTYYAERKADGDWWLIQMFYFFGMRWHKAWEISDEIGDWVELKTQKRVPSWRSEWLSALCIKQMDETTQKASKSNPNTPERNDE